MKDNKNFECGFVVFSIILTVLGFLLAITSAILFLIGDDAAGAVGIVSTISSIALSAMSMAYTYFSGVQTLKVLQDIKRQNDALVEKIRHENAKNNYNEVSADKAFSD